MGRTARRVAATLVACLSTTAMAVPAAEARPVPAGASATLRTVPAFTARLGIASKRVDGSRRPVITFLVVRGVPRRAKAEVLCSGPCRRIAAGPIRKRRLGRDRRAFRNLQIVLRPRTRVEVRVTRRGWSGRYKVLRPRGRSLGLGREGCLGAKGEQIACPVPVPPTPPPLPAGSGSPATVPVTPQTPAPRADPPVSPGGFVTIGSSLQRTPTEDQAESHQQDSVYWNAALPGGGVTAPEDGEIVEVKVKGKVIPAPNGQPPLNQVSVQVLRPDGAVMTVPYPFGSSAAFVLPVGGDADQITTLRPRNLCIRKDDAIGLNTRGGWDMTDSPENGGYYDGVPFQIFATSPGASNRQFHKHDGTGNGSRLENGVGDDPAQPSGPVTRAGQELLMQVTLATGSARSYECGGENRYRS